MGRNVAYDPLYGNYGYQVDPDLLRRARQGPGFGAAMDAALKSMAPSAPTYSSAYGVGATPAPSPARTSPSVFPATPAGSIPRLPARTEVFGLDAPAAPAVSAGSKLADLARRLAPASGQAPPGYRTVAPDTDIARHIAYNAGFGPSDPNRLPGPGPVAGTTSYRVPGVSGMGGDIGQATFRGLPKPPGTGFLGYAGTPETAGMTQAEATAYNVANIDRQTEALRSLNEARQGQGRSSQALPSPPSFDPFARAGDGFGDSGLRAAQYDSLMGQAADTRIPWRRRQGLAEAAQGMLAPGLAAMRQQGEFARSQPQKTGGVDPYQAARLQLDQARLAMAQQNQRDRQQYQQQRDAARDRLAMERQRSPAPEKPQSLDQIKAGMINRLYMATLASQDPNLSAEERDRAQAAVSRLGPFYQQYFGDGPTFQ